VCWFSERLALENRFLECLGPEHRFLVCLTLERRFSVCVATQSGEGSEKSGAGLMQHFENRSDLTEMTSDIRTAGVESKLELLGCCSQMAFLRKATDGT
jgi:hypothetical protein